jgi:hypothetical protein
MLRKKKELRYLIEEKIIIKRLIKSKGSKKKKLKKKMLKKIRLLIYPKGERNMSKQNSIFNNKTFI